VHERFLSWNYLPPHLASRFRASLAPLGCLHLPIQRLADDVASTAISYGISDASALAPILIAFAAANHARQRLSWPTVALPCDEKDKPLGPSEWTLLASLERTRSSLPAPIATAIDSLLTGTNAPDRSNVDLSLLNSDEPALDYGLGVLLPAVTNQESWAIAGRAVGKLARLWAEIRTIFDPQLLAPQPILLTRLAIEVGFGSRAAQAIACAAKPRPDKLPLASLFGHARMREQIQACMDNWIVRAMSVLRDPNAQPLQSFVALVAESVTTKMNEARLYGLIPAKHPPVAELHRAITLARAALEFDPNAQSAWEVQRWGDWSSEPRIGRVFPVGLALLALCRSGHDADERIESMIAQTRRADGWRYYENWTDIPPDTDDLGLVLRLFAAIKQPRIGKNIFHRSFELVRATMNHEGEFPVWIQVGLDEPISENAPNWLGPRCVAVAAQFALGLIEANIEEEDDLRSRVLEWILRTWENHKEAAVFHYTWPFARLLLAKLIHVIRIKKIPDFPDRFHAISSQLVEEIQSAAEVDGGWGSPLATACHVAILALFAPTFDPWPSLTYLAARQGPNGLWPSEPLYRCPGKDGAPMAHGAAIITTGICLDALLDVRERFEREQSAAASSTDDARQRER